MRYSSNDPIVTSGALFDRARDRDLNRFLNDTQVGCIWCGDGIAEHIDNLELSVDSIDSNELDYVYFEHEYFHRNCFDRFIEHQEEKIIKFIQEEKEAAAKCEKLEAKNRSRKER